MMVLAFLLALMMMLLALVLALLPVLLLGANNRCRLFADGHCSFAVERELAFVIVALTRCVVTTVQCAAAGTFLGGAPRP